jgi:hypothetical protein
MWMQDQRSGEATEEEPSVAYAFRHVYQFILRAMQGDTDAASAMFQRYLAGELPEELLALSRRCVQEDQTLNPATPVPHLRAPSMSAPNESAAEAAAVTEFNLNEEQRRLLVVQAEDAE